MDFYTGLDRVIDFLRRRGRITYQALRRHCDLDDAILADLQDEIIKLKQCTLGNER